MNQHAAILGADGDRPDEERISRYRFQDIYVSSDASKPVLATHLHSPDGRRIGGNLASLPPAAAGDALELWAEVCRRWVDVGYRSEFSLDWDGVRYRCALIASPEEGRVKPTEDNVGLVERTWCLRRLSAENNALDQLGMPTWLTHELKSLAHGRGLLLMSGSFGSGKTTSASAALYEWIATEGGIGVTLEDPPEVKLARTTDTGAIYQVEVIEGRFAEAVKNSRRWAPRYLYLGEIRTAEAASELLQVAMGGPMTVSTIHGSGCIEAITSLAKFAGSAMNYELANQMLGEALLGVLHQKIENGRLRVEYLSVSGQESFAIRNKIRRGWFHLLKEELDLQSRRRKHGVAAD